MYACVRNLKESKVGLSVRSIFYTILFVCPSVTMRTALNHQQDASGDRMQLLSGPEMGHQRTFQQVDRVANIL